MMRIIDTTAMKLIARFAELKSVPAPHFEDEEPHNWDVWLSKTDGSYICSNGGRSRLETLVDIGITELVQNTDNDSTKTANIGFNPKEQKWYGWSHRAMYGFGIGSTCKKGDAHFVPKNREEEIEAAVSFWSDSDHENVHGLDKGDHFVIRWTYSQSTPNVDLRGQVNSIDYEYRKTYGRGEWEARTLDDAKQMAVDFANSVS